MSLFFYDMRRKKIKFLSAAIGDISPLAQVWVNLIYMGIRLKGTLRLDWEKGRIRVSREDRIKLQEQFQLQEVQLEYLEKTLYWEYEAVVRRCIYGRMDHLAYCEIFGKNMRLLRQALNLTVSDAAKRLEMKPDKLMEYEACKDDVEIDLIFRKTDSILFKSAALYEIPVLELISQSLFYHFPIKNVPVGGEQVEKVIKEYNKTHFPER